MHVCGVVAFLFVGADISEVEHMANVDVAQLKVDGAGSGSKMGFMVQLSLEYWLWSCMCADLLQFTVLKLAQLWQKFWPNFSKNNGLRAFCQPKPYFYLTDAVLAKNPEGFSSTKTVAQKP